MAKGSCQGLAATRDELCRQVLAVDVGELVQQGHFVGPHVFTDVLPSDPLAQNAFFGPLLAVLQVPDLDEAFRVANGTEYALTGGPDYLGQFVIPVHVAENTLRQGSAID